VGFVVGMTWNKFSSFLCWVVILVYLLLLYMCEKFIAFCGCTEWTWYISSNAEAAGEPEGGGTKAPEW